MTLAELINGLPILETGGDLSQEISAVAYDSRKVTAGTVFVCIEGYITDGHAYITQAVERSAAAVIIQKKTVSHQIPWVLVPNTRRALAHISDRFFAHPSGKLDMIGLTGTKGKTTATYMTRAILSAQGRRAGLIGTIATIIGDQVIQASRTTPESYDLQAILNQMVQSRMDTCVMEVSSQGLMLDRVYGCRYHTGVFTNLYHDHIGPHEHESMDAYLNAKLQLFDLCQQAVINRDIEQFEQIRSVIHVPCLTYGLHQDADVRAENLRQISVGQRSGTLFKLTSPWHNGEVFVGMPGLFNVNNALAAIASAGLSGASLEAVQTGLRDVTVPGRVQLIPSDLPFQVVVDYAHNAASLDHLLKTLRTYVSGRLIVVFGNGGDRARSRRFEMGAVSGQLADLTVITSDNPRSEDPEAIIRDIITGIEPSGGDYHVVVDREEAIKWAIFHAAAGDMVVIAGKGHESYQIFRDRTIHFDDAEIAEKHIKEREVSKNAPDLL